MPNTTPSFDNFFALFEQPIAFNIELEALDKRLRQLQQQFHPDQLSTSDLSAHDSSARDSRASDRATSQNNSALINHAYSTLKYPDNRANYLLELAGQELNLNASISDLDFLDDAMDLRMRLDDANTVTELQSLHCELQPSIEKQSIRFQESYETADWHNAIDATQKLKFLIKIQKDIDDAVDELHQSSVSDDDLYL